MRCLLVVTAVVSAWACSSRQRSEVVRELDQSMTPPTPGQRAKGKTTSGATDEAAPELPRIPDVAAGWGMTADEEDLQKVGLELHKACVLVDGHNDITSVIMDSGFDLGMDGTARKVPTNTDLARMRAGGLDAEFMSIYVDAKYIGAVKGGGAARRAMDLIDVVYEQARKHPNELEVAVSAADVRRIVASGKIALLMGIEGGHAIENSLGALRTFHRLGVRYMTLTHKNTNDWADSSGDKERHDGLSAFGRDVVREMNRIGMMVDVSHVSDDTFDDVIAVSEAPIIASHSSLRALVPHPRNLSDDMLRALKENGGVVMINFFAMYLDPKSATRKGKAPVSLLIDHIDHAVQIAGVDHVGLGSDFDGSIVLPEGLEDTSKLSVITVELLRRGYSSQDIQKILGGNILRVMEEVEKVARKKQSEEEEAGAGP